MYIESSSLNIQHGEKIFKRAGCRHTVTGDFLLSHLYKF